ncbi:MAG: sodium:solute symporter family protein [Deltaproteobacteria bacterium]|nr:sodium:solute symporter family protein [Deltaproteobacteria bacterium]
MEPFSYVYILGTAVFLGSVLVASRTRRLTAQQWLLLLAVFATFFALQAYLQFAPMSEAKPQVYQGGADHLLARAQRGTALDYTVVAIYFVGIVLIGRWAGRRQQTTEDYFFGGRRFAWWLVSASLVASTIGSYSFVKYSNKGFAYGLSSSQTYLNDWIWLPLLLLVWLPMIYRAKITSVPEYFGHRFGKSARMAATLCILVYLLGYVGVNLYTMGKVISALLPISVFSAALIVAVVSAAYVTQGGQSSVIATDLVQGAMLLFVGLLLLYLGAQAVGGFDQLWQHLPRSHRLAFPNFNQSEDFPSVGIFWQDALANSAMYYFLHQGTMMRYMAARSLGDAKKAAVGQIWILMLVAAAVVGAGGWIARALVTAGQLPQTIDAGDAFYLATELLARPGVFGLILAALTAALMSTLDTLVTAVSAIIVNDLYRPRHPAASDQTLLGAARLASLGAMIVGVVLVPLFNQFESIYAAHGAFTAAATPPLVVALIFALAWRRFDNRAALATLFGGLFAIVLSLFFPTLVKPFSHGVPMKPRKAGTLLAIRQYKYTRACYGLVVSAAIGLLFGLFGKRRASNANTAIDRPPPTTAAESYRFTTAACSINPELTAQPTQTVVSGALASELTLTVGDTLYLCDRRRWLGGLGADYARVIAIDQTLADRSLQLAPEPYQRLVGSRKTLRLARVSEDLIEPNKPD